MRAFFKPILFTLILAGGLAGQNYTATYTTPTGLKGYAKGFMSGTYTFSLPANSDLTNGFYKVAGNYSFVGVTAWATIKYSKSSSGGIQTQILECSRAGMTQWGGTATTGAHQTLLTIKSAATISGKVEVIYTLLHLSSNSSCSAKVDVGADQSWEVNASSVSVKKVFPVVVGPSGFQVLTETSSHANTTSSVESWGKFDLQIKFIPGPMPYGITEYGTSCGPKLAGTETATHDLDFNLTQGTPGQAGLLFLGVMKWNIPLPGGNCYLLTDPVLLFPVKTLDTQGQASWQVSVPALRPLQFNVQAVVVDLKQFLFTTTNGLMVSCP